MNKAKFIVRIVNNGFLVDVKSWGMSVLKEPYDPGIYVFISMDELFKFIKELSGDK